MFYSSFIFHVICLLFRRQVKKCKSFTFFLALEIIKKRLDSCPSIWDELGSKDARIDELTDSDGSEWKRDTKKSNRDQAVTFHDTLHVLFFLSPFSVDQIIEHVRCCLSESLISVFSCLLYFSSHLLVSHCQSLLPIRLYLRLSNDSVKGWLKIMNSLYAVETVA